MSPLAVVNAHLIDLYKLSEMDRVAQVFNPTPAHVWKLKTPIDQITSVKRQKDGILGLFCL